MYPLLVADEKDGGHTCSGRRMQNERRSEKEARHVSTLAIDWTVYPNRVVARTHVVACIRLNSVGNKLARTAVALYPEIASMRTL